MKKRLLAAIVTVIMIATTFSALTLSGEAAYEPVGPHYKIMCIGDSITHGGNTAGGYEYTYRHGLWKILMQNYVDFEFVGSRNTGFGAGGAGDATPPYTDFRGEKFSNLHEGYWGWTTPDVETAVNDVLKNKQADVPDIAIINLGTNGDFTDDQKKAHMKSLINMLRGYNENMDILIAGPFCTWQMNLRGKYRELESEMSNENSIVSEVDEKNIKFSDQDYTLDGVHTNQTGDRITAKAIATQLQSSGMIPALKEFKVPADDATPMPKPTQAPVTTTTPSATPTPSQPAESDSPAASAAASEPAPAASATPDVVPTPTPVVKSSLKFAKTSVKVKVKKTVSISVKSKNVTSVKYSVSNKKVIKITKKNKKKVTVKGLKKGSAKVTAKGSGKKSTCKVKVVK